MTNGNKGIFFFRRKRKDTGNEVDIRSHGALKVRTFERKLDTAAK